MSLSGRQVIHYNIMDAKSTTGIGSTIAVKDFRNCVVRIGTASSANLTLKAVGAIGTYANPNTPPDFASTQTVANNWDYVQMVDLSDGTTINGTTGFVCTGVDKFKLYEININSLDFLNFNLTARSAGTVTVEVVLTTNI